MISFALRRLYRDLEQYFCAFLMVLMVSCLGAQVFFRFVLNASLTWSEELSRFAFIWLVYMGAVLGAKERIHIRVTAFQRLLPAPARSWTTPLADLLWVSINLVFAWQGALQVGHLLRFSYISPALQWNMAVIYAVVPLGFALMSFRIVEGYWRDWRRGTLGQAPEGPDGAPGGGPAPNPASARPTDPPGPPGQADPGDRIGPPGPDASSAPAVPMVPSGPSGDPAEPAAPGDAAASDGAPASASRPAPAVGTGPVGGGRRAGRKDAP